MIISTENKINRCRPGFGASCSFCCGSHNYTLSPDEMEDLFINRDNGSSRSMSLHPEDTCAEKLVKEGMQCPHVGISSSEPGIICCLTYYDDHSESVFRSFFNGTCRTFMCTAWKELTDRHVIFAAKLFRDWYYYSLLINSPDIVMELCAEYDDPREIPAETVEELKTELREKLMEDDLI